MLHNAGCVYQERQGWERPGWFSPDGPAPVQEYDYYGAYDNEVHTDHAYANRLRQNYTFDFPKHHEQVGGNLGMVQVTVNKPTHVHSPSHIYQHYGDMVIHMVM